MAAGDRTIDSSTKTNLFLIVYGILCLMYSLFYLIYLTGKDESRTTSSILKHANTVTVLNTSSKSTA